MTLSPKFALGFQLGGVAKFYTGEPSKALDDLHQASELDPKNPYAAIWLEIIEKRVGSPLNLLNVSGDLAQSVTQIDVNKWPGPVIRLYLGQLTPAAVLARLSPALTVAFRLNCCLVDSD
jgi:lipoprotein NlpI